MEILLSVTSSRIKKKRNTMCFVLELKDRFPNACRVAVLLQYAGICANSFPNPSSASIFEQNTASFIARADATSSAFMVDITSRPCSPHLKLIGAFASIVTYLEVDFPLSGFFAKFESEKFASLKPPFCR